MYKGIEEKMRESQYFRTKHANRKAKGAFMNDKSRRYTFLSYRSVR